MQLHKKFIEVALQNKDKVAVHDATSKKDYTYKQLLIAAFILSDKFKKIDEQYIGILLPVSAGETIGILGTLFSGKTAVMINYSTGALKNSEFAKEKCEFSTILTSRVFLEKLHVKPIKGMIFLEDILQKLTLVSKIKGLLKSKLSTTFVHNGSKDDIAFILFTSGSEKDPKAVMLSHGNILANYEDIVEVFDFNESDTFMSVLPFFHIFGLTTSFWTPLLVGATFIAQPNPLEYTKIVKLIYNNKASVLTATPSFFYGYNQKAGKNELNSLRIAVSGGDKLSKAISTEFYEKQSVILYEGYGTTETSPVISANTRKDYKLGSIGKPLPNVEVKILNIDTDEIMDVGQQGKIYVKGENVMKGYLDDFEETSLHMHNCWYDTGDMGYLDKDGYLWHTGRLKRFVKIGGEMISLAAVEVELENIISSSCCVIDLHHPTKGAVLVAAVTKEINSKKIIKELSENLPKISIPKKYIFFETLPMSGNGKVNFRKVKKEIKALLKK